MPHPLSDTLGGNAAVGRAQATASVAWNARMSNRQPIGDVFQGISPFLAGMVAGSVVAGGLLCFAFRTYVVAFADKPASPFDAFLIWMLFGVTALLVVAAIWGTIALTLVWILSPWPVTARPGQVLFALGSIASTIITVGVALSSHYGGGAIAALMAMLATLVAPFLMVTRDSDS